MAEYIEREAVLKAFRLMAKNPDKRYEKGMQDTIDCLVPQVIADIPTADVKPVKRGKMIAMSDEEKYRVYKDTARDYDGRCSLCNCCVYDTDIFCAECGAILQDADATKDEI